jgi:hypothetical protein
METLRPSAPALRIGGLLGQSPAAQTGTRGDWTARGTNLTLSIWKKSP